MRRMSSNWWMQDTTPRDTCPPSLRLGDKFMQEKPSMSEPITRYVGLDVHKSYCMVGAVDSGQNVVLPPRKITLTSFETWAAKELKTSDAVVLEVSANAWELYDMLHGK